MYIQQRLQTNFDCIYIYKIYIHANMCIWEPVYLCTQNCMRVYRHICTFIHKWINIHIYVNVYMNLHKCMYVYFLLQSLDSSTFMYIYECVFVCIFIHVSVHMCLGWFGLHIYIYVGVSSCRKSNCWMVWSTCTCLCTCIFVCKSIHVCIHKYTRWLGVHKYLYMSVYLYADSSNIQNPTCFRVAQTCRLP